MRSPVSPILPNLFIHSLETSAITKWVNPPEVWLQYVDDIFVNIKRNGLEEIFENVNIAHSITVPEDIESTDKKLAFLNCLTEWMYKCYSGEKFNQREL